MNDLRSALYSWLDKLNDNSVLGIEPAFTVIKVHRICRGNTARVLPGVTGKVIDTTADGWTFVSVNTLKMRTAILKAIEVLDNAPE